MSQSPKVKCPYCGEYLSRVVDTGPASDSNGVYRRRECLTCFHRYPTREVLDEENFVPPISGGQPSKQSS